MNCIFTNARLLPVSTPGFNPHDSLAVREGRIAVIGSPSDCRAAFATKPEIIDLKEKILIPAFTDTHTHFVEFSKKSLQLDLHSCSSFEQIRARIDTFLSSHPHMPAWVLGGGWDKNILDEPAHITREFLDRHFPDIPVCLYSKDYHSRWCNSPALKRAGWSDDSPDPKGGKLGRHPDGRLNGILYETASELMSQHIIDPTEEETSAAIRDTIASIHRLGLASVHTMERRCSADILEKVIRADRSLRACWHFPFKELDRVIASGKASYEGDGWFLLGGVKLFADGALGSQTAAMLQPYPGDGANYGILRLSGDELYAIAERAAEHGLSCCVHAIGELAVRTVINAYLRLRQKHPAKHLLQRIEHLQSIDPSDLQDLKRSGAYCAMQPVHLANDIDMVERYWQPIRSHAYSFKSLSDIGITFGFGSDAPIETINPFHGIYSAIARRNRLDPSQPVWLPEQRINVFDAIRAYTLDATRGSRSEHRTGSLEVGKDADLIVLDDFTRLDQEYWLSAESLLTMVGGQIVWSRL
jgi:predicted amidohydrolase YtcJ